MFVRNYNDPELADAGRSLQKEKERVTYVNPEV
jgi:hypothetical protein